MAPPARLGGVTDHKVRHQRIEDEGIIEEKYQFGETLGQGSFGIVILATNLETNQQWAMKKINKEKAGSSGITLLEREVAILKRVNHEHIIHLEEVYETSKKMYLVMELCQLGELKLILASGGPFTEPSARHVVSGIASAVVYLHKDGIVHRDMKLENILIADCIRNEDGDPLYNVKITDFGLSVVKDGVGCESLLQAACGTPVYMAPEVIQNHEYSQQCDNWSIGVILYALLSGDFPFVAESEERLYELITRGEVEFPKGVWRLKSEGVKSLISNLLKTDPAHRLTASEIASHPWTLGGSGSAGSKHINVLELMKDYAKEMANNHDDEDRDEFRENSDDVGREASDEEENKRPVTSGVTEALDKPSTKVKTKSAPLTNPGSSYSTHAPVQAVDPSQLYPPSSEVVRRGSMPSLKNPTTKPMSGPRKIYDNKTIGRNTIAVPVAGPSTCSTKTAKSSVNSARDQYGQRMSTDHGVTNAQNRLKTDGSSRRTSSAVRPTTPSTSNSNNPFSGRPSSPPRLDAPSQSFQPRRSSDSLRASLQSASKSKKKSVGNRQ